MNIPLDKKLYEKAKKIVYKQYNKPSAYRSGALVKKYKELGGKYTINSSSKNVIKPLKRWFNEKWVDIGGLDYPVYRPSKRITKNTPLTVHEIDPKQAKIQIKLKQKIRGKKNLPPFKKKSVSSSRKRVSSRKRISSNRKRVSSRRKWVSSSRK